jgi:hypothetical protein
MATVYTTTADPRFDRVITLRDAYRIMYGFALEYERRGDLPVSAFTTYAGLLTNGRSADPAALDDFLEEAGKVLAPDVVADISDDAS